jgi:hypothetical protein
VAPTTGRPTRTRIIAGRLCRLSRSAPIQAGFVAACAGAALAVAVLYLFLAEPTYDDFCRAAVPTDEDAPRRYAANMYQYWTGRWLAMWGYGWAMPRLGIETVGYSLALVGVMLAWIGGFLIAVDLIAGRAARRRDRAALALILFTIFWCGAPSLWDGFYWLTGGTEYALPFVLVMAALRLIAALREGPLLWPLAAAAGVVGILVAGINEGAALPLAGLIACHAAGAWWLGRRRIAAASLFALALVAAGLWFNLSAPGTARRIAFQSPERDVLSALLHTVKPYRAPLAWLVDLRMVALSLLLLALPRFVAVRPQWASLPIPWVAVIPAITLAGIAGEYFLASYALGDEPYGRVQNLLYAIMLIGWVATLVAVAARLGPAGAESTALQALRPCAVLLLGLSLVTAPNTAAALGSVPVALGSWRQDNMRLDRIVAAQVAAGRREVLVPPIPIRPAPLLEAGVTEDPSYFVNYCMANYLGVERVRRGGAL